MPNIQNSNSTPDGPNVPLRHVHVLLTSKSEDSQTNPSSFGMLCPHSHAFFENFQEAIQYEIVQNREHLTIEFL